MGLLNTERRICNFMKKCVLEIEHKSLYRCRIDMNDQIITDVDDISKVFSHTITISDAPSTVAIWFWPWKITPLLRINNHLVNYGLLQAKIYDHQIAFDIDTKWLDRYRDTMIQGSIDNLFKNTDFNKKMYDSAIGYNIDYSDIITEIRKKINE